MNTTVKAPCLHGAFGPIRQVAYVESTEIPGLILELIEWNDLTRPYFDGIGKFLAAADKNQLKHDYKL